MSTIKLQIAILIYPSRTEKTRAACSLQLTVGPVGREGGGGREADVREKSSGQRNNLKKKVM